MKITWKLFPTTFKTETDDRFTANWNCHILCTAVCKHSEIPSSTSETLSKDGHWSGKLSETFIQVHVPLPLEQYQSSTIQRFTHSKRRQKVQTASNDPTHMKVKGESFNDNTKAELFFCVKLISLCLDSGNRKGQWKFRYLRIMLMYVAASAVCSDCIGMLLLLFIIVSIRVRYLSVVNSLMKLDNVFSKYKYICSRESFTDPLIILPTTNSCGRTNWVKLP